MIQHHARLCMTYLLGSCHRSRACVAASAAVLHGVVLQRLPLCDDADPRFTLDTRTTK